MNVSRDTLTVAMSAFVTATLVSLWLSVDTVHSRVQPAQLNEAPGIYETLTTGIEITILTVVIVTLLTLTVYYLPEGWLDPFTDHERR